MNALRVYGGGVASDNTSLSVGRGPNSLELELDAHDILEGR
jgi:hypothetical protein